MDKYGNVSLGDMQERTYFSLTQRGKVEIAETKFLTVLKSQGLPSDRKALIETLDKIPREKLNISEGEMREAILNFQKKQCGTRVIPNHTNEPQEKFTPRKLAPAEDVFLTTCW
jgi:DNA-binding PadR family transcriptional regulator